MRLQTVRHRDVAWDVWVGPAGSKVWQSDLEILFVPRRAAGDAPHPVYTIAATGAIRNALLEGAGKLEEKPLIGLLKRAMANRGRRMRFGRVGAGK